MTGTAIPTEEQHFVPRFYLRRFTGPKNEVQILDAVRLKLMTPRGTRGICKERFFYAVETGKPDDVSQHAENVFRDIENEVALRIAPVAEALAANKHIEEQGKWDVAYLMAMIWARGPVMRNQINTATESVMKQVLRVALDQDHADRMFDRVDREKGKTSSQELRAQVREEIERGNHRLSFNNVQHLRFMEDLRGWANLFHGQYWRVYLNQTAESFVTSDNPVAVFAPERKGFYGPTFLERTHYFALSPEICIEAVYPDHDRGKKIRRTTLFAGQEWEAVQLNARIASRASHYVYARDRRPLETLRDVALRIRQDPLAPPKHG